MSPAKIDALVHVFLWLLAVAFMLCLGLLFGLDALG